MRLFPSGRKRTAAAGPVLVIVLALLGAAQPAGSGHAAQASRTQPPCTPVTGPPPPVTATTIGTIEQAYHCIFDHYYDGATRDNRPLLTAAFVALTQELQRRGIERADATMPALSGDRDGDWAAFAAVYERVTGSLPAEPALRQAVAATTMTAMVASLLDNHATWSHREAAPGAKPGDTYGLGIAGVSGRQGSRVDPTATPPLFVTSVQAGSPAAAVDVRPGDTIVSVDGVLPFADGVLSAGVLSLLNPLYPEAEQVKLTLHRPATGRTRTVTITPALFPAPPSSATGRLLDGDIAYVALPGFYGGSADQVRQAVAGLGAGRTLRGLVLDLRGNRGGSVSEVNRLLGAFAHGKITGYHCAADGSCAANHTDDRIPLLNLPLVVLTDRNCASACDHFSSAVKDLHLGPLVGARTAGLVSGPANGYLLSDNSTLGLSALRHLGPNREVVDGIGVAPDHYIPRSAHDLSTGRDPARDKASDLLTN
jgi:carboxyl-terminal processing protease